MSEASAIPPPEVSAPESGDISGTRANARYTNVAIVLHWLIAALLVFEVGLGLRMEGAQGAAKFAVFQLHKSVGITILLLVVLRLAWRLIRKPPALIARGWERALAHNVHLLFYGILFALPISGWIIVSTSRIDIPTLLYGTIPWPHVPGFAATAATAKTGWNEAAAFTHVTLAFTLAALFALHVAGALKHHFVDRDGDLARMVPGARAGSLRDPRLLAIAVGAVIAIGAGLAWAPIGPGVTTSPPPAPLAPVPIEPASGAVPVTPPLEAAASAPPAPATEATLSANMTDTARLEPSRWAIAPGSTVQFETNWSGSTIRGGFTRFDGTIVFDPDQMDRSSVAIDIQTGSVFSGDGQRDEMLKTDNWFAVASYGSALFKAARFRKTGANQFIANGSLRIRGITLPVSLPFTLTITGNKASMRGTATIDRTAYRIGEGMADIPPSVSVIVEVQATRKP